MGAIDQLIQIQISQATASVAQASFAIPLIVGPTANGWSGGDYVHTYSSPAGMLTDGYTTGSPEYVYALELCGQSVQPVNFLVGKRTAAVAQVDTLAVNTLTIGHAYVVTINGTALTYTASGGDTQQVILGQLLTQAIATGFVTGAVTGTGVSALLTLTGASPGLAITYSGLDTLLTKVALTPVNGIASDLANIIAQNNTWYGMVFVAATDADILQAAAAIEALIKIFVAASSTTAIGTSATTDVASVLKAKSYKRTALIFSPASAALGIDAAWVGGQLPQTPGSNNWAFKTLAGVVPDTLTATQQSILIGTPVAGTAGKNANIYQVVGGQPITEMGTMAGGQYIDITVGLDWLQSTIQTNIYAAVVAAKKIPYSDIGTGIVISCVKSAIDQGVANGLIDGASAITITAAAVATVSANNRAKRIAPTINFGCRLAGAYNAFLIAGTVTV